ncbi:MAG: cell division protein FtsA [Deltaproteobacteria bacterium]|nr:cell division protein FtsA [Deltaproteobacteria bacterium]
MAKKDNLIVGLDIGTTKICAVVGEVTHDGIDIIGIGSHPSRGLRKGVIVNIEATIESINKAIDEAELMAGCDIVSVYAALSGSHIQGINSHSIVSVKNRLITEKDVERVIDGASAIVMPMDREIIHVIPQEYTVDEQDGIKEPVGMAGAKFEANVHIVTASVSCIQNVVKCANRCALNITGVVLSPIASAEACLSEDEKELGVIVIDMGGGTTDVVIYVNGSVVHSAVLPLGGNHISNDIAVGLRTPNLEAEKIKQKYGCALSSLVNKEDTIDVPSVGGRKSRVLSRQILAEIIEPRLEEIFDLVKQEVIRSGYEDNIASGVVLTGGVSVMDGVPELAEQVFDFPVVRATPRGIGGLVDVIKSPMYATGVGLVIYGHARKKEELMKTGEKGVYIKVKERMKNWFAEMF